MTATSDVRRGGAAAAAPDRRPPGRPRSQAADEAILAAARSVLADDGWPGFTVERVAARAGVAKTTLYRRWSSREDLAVAAVADLIAAACVAPADNAADDIRNAVRSVGAAMGEPASRAAYLALVAAAARDQELRDRVHRLILGPTRDLVDEGLARAVARGEVPAGIDPGLVHDLIAGTVSHRVLVRGQEIDEEFLDAVTRLAMALAHSGA